MPTQLLAYLDILNGLLLKDKYHTQLYRFVAEEGRKYWKIVKEYNPQPYADARVQRSVHAFVDKDTLDVFKAESWSRPARGIRYNLHTDLDLLEEVADPYTSYLYSRK